MRRVIALLITIAFLGIFFISASYAETWKAVSYNPSLEEVVAIGTGDNFNEATANALLACKSQDDSYYGCVLGAAAPHDWNITVWKCPYLHIGVISFALKMKGMEVLVAEPDGFARELADSGETVSGNCELDMIW